MYGHLSNVAPDQGIPNYHKVLFTSAKDSLLAQSACKLNMEGNCEGHDLGSDCAPPERTFVIFTVASARHELPSLLPLQSILSNFSTASAPPTVLCSSESG